jgi:hypothetical protein
MMLKRLMRAREHLRVIVVKDAWQSAMKPAYTQRGREVSARISSSEFWTAVRRCLAVMRPVYLLLREMDGEKTLMGSYYRRMFEARKELCSVKGLSHDCKAAVLDAPTACHRPT